MNPVAGLPYAPSTWEAVEAFHAVLRERRADLARADQLLDA